jgi:hypothetical protein
MPTNAAEPAAVNAGGSVGGPKGEAEGQVMNRLGANAPSRASGLSYSPSDQVLSRADGIVKVFLPHQTMP